MSEYVNILKTENYLNLHTCGYAIINISISQN
jgi:hypothetical protein